MERFATGDSYLLTHVLDDSSESPYFDILKDEVEWQNMYNRSNPVPRLIAVQGDISPEGIKPLYRHPADEEPVLKPWSPTIERLRSKVSELLSVDFNHALIQYYRSGRDNIGRHADKTLDIQRGTQIVNLSFGATRTMILRSKVCNDNGEYQIEKIALPNHSLFVLGWESNRQYHHYIKLDKRDDTDKQADELLYGGKRISITLRSVATYIDEQGRIFGQGGKLKSRSELEQSGPSEALDIKAETIRMLEAFSAENRDPDFDWDKHYGCGFDVLNFQVINRE